MKMLAPAWTKPKVVMSSAARVNGRRPSIFMHAQDRRDECTGMADADPEHGIDQEDAPEDRAVYTGHTQALRDQVIPGIEQSR